MVLHAITAVTDLLRSIMKKPLKKK